MIKKKLVKIKNILLFPFNFLLNVYFLLALFPLYIKIKNLYLGLIAMIINYIIFGLFTLYLLFISMNKIFGPTPDDKYAYITQDPSVIFNKLYGEGVIFLAFFYFYALRNGRLDKKSIIKNLME